MKKGLFIVLYGINNLGKSTQAKLIVQELCDLGHPTEYLKYPIYDLEPSGPILNNYLRGGNPFNLTSREMQIIQTINRTQYETKLLEKLTQGITLIAEDYTGTGLAWGIGSGVDENFLKNINSHLYREDLAFLFDGERFTKAIENDHKHETDDELTQKVRSTHQKLAAEYNWHPVQANRDIKTITEEILNKIKEKIDTNI